MSWMWAMSETGPVSTTGDPRGRVNEVQDRWVGRRITLIWMLLFFNVLPWMGLPTVVPIPQRVAQLLAAAALGMAVVLAIDLNRGLVIRPKLVLLLFSMLFAAAVVTSVRGTAGMGGLLRCGRLGAFLLVLWLLTPWWGRRDLLLARCHFRALVAVLATVVMGLLLAPSMALAVNEGRLAGALWPIWPTAVAHFAALAGGMAVVLWLAGSGSGARAVLFGGGGIALVVMSHTRTALVALFAGLACAAFSLLLARQRARRAFTVALVVIPLVVVAFAPALTAWFKRGQTDEELRSLTGRKQAWAALLEAPRPAFNHWLGFGLSDKGFQGRSVDNSWLVVYHEQGLVGVTILGGIVLFLLVAPAFCRAGTPRALALFIVVYVVIDSYTEVGPGDASPYLLDLVVAASLLAGSPVSGSEWVPDEVPD